MAPQQKVLSTESIKSPSHLNQGRWRNKPDTSQLPEGWTLVQAHTYVGLGTKLTQAGLSQATYTNRGLKDL